MEYGPQITQISTDFVEEEQDPETYQLIGAAMEVHRHLGSGFLERVYQLALAEELGRRGIPFEPEVDLTIRYKGIELECRYRADMVCNGSILMELKAKDRLTETDISQVINYLNATGFKRGLLINFGSGSLQHKRIVS